MLATLLLVDREDFRARPFALKCKGSGGGEGMLLLLLIVMVRKRRFDRRSTG